MGLLENYETRIKEESSSNNTVSAVLEDDDVDEDYMAYLSYLAQQDNTSELSYPIREFINPFAAQGGGHDEVWDTLGEPSRKFEYYVRDTPPKYIEFIPPTKPSWGDEEDGDEQGNSIPEESNPIPNKEIVAAGEKEFVGSRKHTKKG